MKKILPLLLASSFSIAAQDLKINGMFDGTMSGTPQMIEFYVTADIADLSDYCIGRASNGSAILNPSFCFISEAWPSGSYFYMGGEVPNFTSYFGFAPDYNSTGLLSNGNDVIGLFWDDPGTMVNDPVLIDVFGVVGTDGIGESWEHTDSWVKRNADNGPDGETFVESNWSFEPVSILDVPSCSDSGSKNDSCVSPYPFGFLPVELMNYSVE
jgi:hypothetical protein